MYTGIHCDSISVSRRGAKWLKILAKVGVASSSLVSRSRFLKGGLKPLLFLCPPFIPGQSGKAPGFAAMKRRPIWLASSEPGGRPVCGRGLVMACSSQHVHDGRSWSPLCPTSLFPCRGPGKSLCPSGQGRQGLARVEDAVGIELTLDAVHQAQGYGVQFPGDEVTLGQTHAVLAGEGALQGQDQAKDRV